MAGGALQLLARAAGKQSRRARATRRRRYLLLGAASAARALPCRGRRARATRRRSFMLLLGAVAARALRPCRGRHAPSHALAPALHGLGVAPIRHAASDDDDHVRVRAREANAGAGPASGAAVVRPAPRAYLLVPTLEGLLATPTVLRARSGDHVLVRAGVADSVAFAMVRPAPSAYLLAPSLQGLLTAPLLHGFGTASLLPARSGDHFRVRPTARAYLVAPGLQGLLTAPLLPPRSEDLVRVRAREPDTVVGGAALNLTADYASAMLYVDDAALSLGVAMFCVEDAALNLGGSMFCVEDAALNLGGAMLCVEDAALNLGGALICIEDATLGPRDAAFPAPPLERHVAATAAIVSAPRVIVAALLHRAQVGAKEAAAVAGAAPNNGSRSALAIPITGAEARGFLVSTGAPRGLGVCFAGKKPTGVTGQRGYCTKGGGNGKPDGDGDGSKPRLQNQRKIMAKLSKLQFHVRRIEKCVISNTKFIQSQRREMFLKGEKLKKQVRMLPLRFFTWLLLGIALACYLVVEVIAPRAAEVASEKFIALANELKDMANEADEDKIKKMATDLTQVITNAILDCVGGSVKTSMWESLKFWKWGRKP